MGRDKEGLHVRKESTQINHILIYLYLPSTLTVRTSSSTTDRARMTPPPSSPTWVFLNRKACVCGGEGGDSEPVLLQGADDVSLELAAPPRESVLTVSPRVLLGDVSVLALDPSAGLVLV
ncbi:hypothetical protein [Oryza sativa Japonica Group]|uniref:Uncharacterized protein n=2 Tax=Oryza sativa subsp. japonica TaxID=39947 RepID=Q5NA59_ORYSJ|nr:hypothetical protein [Oryza sativa Japonica Group]